MCGGDRKICVWWKGHKLISDVVRPERSDCSSSTCVIVYSCIVAHGASVDNVTSTNHVIHGSPMERGLIAPRYFTGAAALMAQPIVTLTIGFIATQNGIMHSTKGQS